MTRQEKRIRDFFDDMTDGEKVYHYNEMCNEHGYYEDLIEDGAHTWFETAYNSYIV